MFLCYSICLTLIQDNKYNYYLYCNFIVTICCLWCVCVCLCAPILPVCLGAHKSTMQCGSQRLMSSFVFYHCPSPPICLFLFFCFWRQGLSLNLEFSDSAGLSRQQAAGILLSHFSSTGSTGTYLHAHDFI